jgi:hypothetical protein
VAIVNLLTLNANKLLIVDKRKEHPLRQFFPLWENTSFESENGGEELLLPSSLVGCGSFLVYK